jgi:DNA replication protein DnaC
MLETLENIVLTWRLIMPNLQLNNLVQQLRLSGISDSLEGRLRQARDASMPYEELLLMLLQDELDSRDQTSLQRRVSQAKFEETKTFEGFDLKRYSLKIRHAINDLMTAKFIKEKNHVIIMGPVGTGKTHLSQALGMLACQRNRKVKFIRSNELLNEFYRSRADCTYDTLFKRYTKFDVLILDDFGLKTLSAEQSSDLYDLIAGVHINASLIITTNRKIETWAEIFFDPVMANAALDRIVNNSYRVVLEGDSYRKNFIPKFKIEDDKMQQKS